MSDVIVPTRLVLWALVVAGVIVRQVYLPEGLTPPDGWVRA